MHIPDGMLEARTWIPAWLGSAAALAFALREVRRRLTDSTIVMMAVLAALIFALQMLNFPVAGGTSGHFAGGAAAAIVLGVWPAMVVMAAVVTVQALFFADGGVTTLGANLLTLAIIGPLVGWAIHGALLRLSKSRTIRIGASFAAAWAACVASALGAAVMLWLSGRAPLAPALAAMGFWHALIGLGEGAITAGLIGYVLAVRPDLLDRSGAHPTDARSAYPAAVGLGLLALLAAGASFIASANPDGLERAYGNVGEAFSDIPLLTGPMPEYVLPGISNEALAGVLAGVVGVVVSGALVYGLLAGARSRRATGGPEGGTRD